MMNEGTAIDDQQQAASSTAAATLDCAALAMALVGRGGGIVVWCGMAEPRTTEASHRTQSCPRGEWQGDDREENGRERPVRRMAWRRPRGEWQGDACEENGRETPVRRIGRETPARRLAGRRL